MFRSNRIFFLLAIFLSASILLSGSARAEETSPVRVLVSEDQKMMRVSVAGDYQILSIPSLQVVKKGRKLLNAWIVPTAGGVRIGKEEWAGRGIRIIPSEDRDLVLNHSRFRGSVTVLKSKNGLLYAINTLGLEKYLYGVLHHEVAAWWPMEALKAQAVAARTYALYETLVSKGAEYDVKSSTSSQVYGGSTTERYRTRRAVNQTAGQVLVSDGKVFPAYFHATCAGVTASAEELWKIRIKPISGGVRCQYCKISPHYSWEAKVPVSDIEEKLKQYHRPVGRILKIEIVSQTPSKRVGSVRITGTAGEVLVAAKDFRVWVGGDRMRSTLFTLDLHDDFVFFHGMGWGHGVGLCQWGTLGQALLGRGYQEILEYYYPGAEIQDAASKGTR